MKRKSMWFGWQSDLMKELEAGSKTAETSRGFVEYAVGGTGPALLALHGAPGGYDQGLLHFREMAARGFAVLAPSRPGYLRSPIGGGLTPGEQAELMAALLDKLGLERVVVAGFSEGGPCALEFAVRYPERTCGLILLSAITRKYVQEEHCKHSAIDTLFDYDLGSWFLSLVAHYAPNLMVKAIVDAGGVFEAESAIADRIAEGITMEPEKVAFVAEVIDTMLPASRRRRGAENDMRQLSRLSEIAIERITAPTLIIHGAQDRQVPGAYATFAASHIAGAELVLVEEGIHLLDLSLDADMIWDRMEQFLRKQGVNASVLNGG